MSLDIPNKINKLSDKITINNYTIIERIGVGSYGRIYKVKKDEIIYVLKEIPFNKNVNNEKLESVKNEAEILSSLSNKYIVQYYESFQMGQNIYIVMKYYKMENYKEAYDRKYYNLNENDVNDIKYQNELDIKDCAKDICVFVDNVNKSNYLSCKNKYSDENFEKVSLII